VKDIHQPNDKDINSKEYRMPFRTKGLHESDNFNEGPFRTKGVHNIDYPEDE